MTPPQKARLNKAQHYQPIALILFIAVVVVVACVQVFEWQRGERYRQVATRFGGPQMPSRPMEEAHAAMAEFDWQLHTRKSITFRSWNGVKLGMDADTDLTFLPNGKAHMFEYGFSLIAYHGTYHINELGGVTVNFPTYKHAWPLMQLRKDSKSLLLEPKAPGTEFQMGNRGGATIQSGQGKYWPFRPVSAKAEKEIRDQIK